MSDTTKESKVLKSKYIPTAEFYSQVIDSLQDYSIFTLDIDLKINSWSNGSETIFGYDSDEILGEDFDIIFTDEDKKAGTPKKEIDSIHPTKSIFCKTLKGFTFVAKR